MCDDIAINAALRLERVDVLGPLRRDVIDPGLPKRGLPQGSLHQLDVLRRRQVLILFFVMAFDFLFILEMGQCLVILI